MAVTVGKNIAKPSISRSKNYAQGVTQNSWIKYRVKMMSGIFMVFLFCFVF